MEGSERAGNRRTLGSRRFGIAAMAVLVGLVFAPLPGVAWAEPTIGGSTSAETSHAGPADRTESTRPVNGHDDTKDDAPTDDSSAKDSGTEGRDEPGNAAVPADDPESDTGIRGTEADTSASAAPPAETQDPEPVVPETDSVIPDDGVAAETRPGHDRHVVNRPVVAFGRAAGVHDSAPVATVEPAAGVLTLDVPSARPVAAEPTVPAHTDAASPAPVTVTRSITVETTTPTAPEPLSPVAELLQLPGRLINAVLQAFDITTTANGPHSPINIAPINDLLFAAFRELERCFGLDRPPAVQPVPTLTYTGPTTTPTPTVAQFLNASTAAYGLGTTPGGLVPFTVHGFQVKSVNIFTGFAAKTWVTPDGQVIIAYSGTTGGTNLLFNPLVAVTQIMTDLQVIYTKTTPWAFYDALHFARRVQAAAALQGYDFDDIFVTGHSLGGWEAQYVAQQIGLAGIGFESPGMNTTVPGNGADSLFVNIETYGDAAPFMSTDLPGLQPFMPPYVPGGGSKPHYGSIVMIGDPAAMTPLINASALWRTGLIGNIIFLVDFLGNFFQYHLPGVQAYHLDVVPDPGVVPWMGTARGPVNTGYGNLTIPQLLEAASDAGTLFRP